MCQEEMAGTKEEESLDELGALHRTHSEFRQEMDAFGRLLSGDNGGSSFPSLCELAETRSIEADELNELQERLSSKIAAIETRAQELRTRAEEVARHADLFSHLTEKIEYERRKIEMESFPRNPLHPLSIKLGAALLGVVAVLGIFPAAQFVSVFLLVFALLLLGCGALGIHDYEKKKWELFQNCFPETKKLFPFITKKKRRKPGEGIELGFCLNYWDLTYKRKLIRTLWSFPLTIALMFAMILRFFSFTDMGLWGVCFFILYSLGWSQVAYTFIMWQREERCTNCGASSFEQLQKERDLYYQLLVSPQDHSPLLSLPSLSTRVGKRQLRSPEEERWKPWFLRAKH